MLQSGYTVHPFELRGRSERQISDYACQFNKQPVIQPVRQKGAEHK